MPYLGRPMPTMKASVVRDCYVKKSIKAFLTDEMRSVSSPSWVIMKRLRFVSTTSWIRLCKRMSELDICSRREADRLILAGRVLVQGTTAIVGDKVPSDLSQNDIEILNMSDSQEQIASASTDDITTTADTTTSRTRRSITRTGHYDLFDSVLLNKPAGYVSGQAEHGHPPAIRLLTKNNLVWNKYNDELLPLSSSPFSWKGFAPAGRLDLESTGLIIYTRNGVLAKKLISNHSTIEKEYIVDVVPAVQPTKWELQIDPTFQLPSPPMLDLTSVVSGGQTLLENNNNKNSNNKPSRPLKPCHVEWLDDDHDDDDKYDYDDHYHFHHRDNYHNRHSSTIVSSRRKNRRLRFCLSEGRKRHIRRVCRELLGWHVVSIRRIRIGPITLFSNNNNNNNDDDDDILPEGCWRPLRQDEIDSIISN